MTGDEIRRLIGSYAIGSLTEAERKALYEAALEDQELFDELAREHAFKELLEEPGAKQRLLAALSAPERSPVSTGRGWRWATAALIAASVAIAIIAGRNKLYPPAKPPVEIARIASEPREPSPPPEAPAPVPAAKPKAMAPKAPQKRPESQTDETSVSTGQLVSPAAVPAPSPFVTPQVGQTAPAGLGGAVRRAQAPASFKAALMRAPRFAFDYEVEAGGTLMIKSATAGYLQVAANSATGTTVIFPATGTGRVDIDSVNRIPIPAGTQELVVTLLAQPALDSVPGLSSTSENTTGTVEDPNPSVNSKLVLTLRVHY